MRKSSTFEAGWRDHARPLPEFTFLSTSSTYPAAWEFTIEYPAHRMSILGVQLLRGSPGEAFLDWDASDAETTCAQSTGQLSLKIADPERLTAGVRVAYQLENTNAPSCQAAIVDTEIVLGSGSQLKAYDADGAAISFPPMDKYVH
jgi:hypothetical protein